MRRVHRAYFVGLYLTSWLVFGMVGLLLNLSCALLLPFPRSRGLQRLARRAIRFLFEMWTRWLHATRVVGVRWVDFPSHLPEGTIYVANHPTLVDATLLLSRLHNAFCIFKPALMRNPCIAPAAVLAGYVSGGRHVDTIREAARHVSAGQSLLVFPEGTRTLPGYVLGGLKPGFALIASRSRSPVQAIVITCTPGLVSKGRSWWRPPAELPAWVEIRLGRTWAYDPQVRSVDLTAQVTDYFKGQLTEPVA